MPEADYKRDSYYPYRVFCSLSIIMRDSIDSGREPRGSERTNPIRGSYAYTGRAGSPGRLPASDTQKYLFIISYVQH